MMKTYQFCNNCGKQGHMFHRCKKPITSIGIIIFRIINGERQYLTICRRNSLGYVDFMRGKYPLSNKIYLKNIIYEMTNDEKQSLLKNEFDRYRSIQQPHPIFQQHNLNYIPYQHEDLDKWRNSLSGGIGYSIENTNLFFYGGVDGIRICTMQVLM